MMLHTHREKEYTHRECTPLRTSAPCGKKYHAKYHAKIARLPFVMMGLRFRKKVPAGRLPFVDFVEIKDKRQTANDKQAVPQTP